MIDALASDLQTEVAFVMMDEDPTTDDDFVQSCSFAEGLPDSAFGGDPFPVDCGRDCTSGVGNRGGHSGATLRAAIVP